MISFFFSSRLLKSLRISCLYFTELSQTLFLINAGRGVLSWFTNRVSLFISGLPPEESDKITERHGKNVSALVEESLIRNVGSPIADLLEYLENEHLPHCVPSNVSSGLGTLPVPYVYFNGSRTIQRTNRTLVNGDRIISGKESYSGFMSFHTTQSITPGNFSRCFFLKTQKYFHLICRREDEGSIIFHSLSSDASRGGSQGARYPFPSPLSPLSFPPLSSPCVLAEGLKRIFLFWTIFTHF